MTIVVRISNSQAVVYDRAIVTTFLYLAVRSSDGVSSENDRWVTGIQDAFYDPETHSNCEDPRHPAHKEKRKLWRRNEERQTETKLTNKPREDEGPKSPFLFWRDVDYEVKPGNIERKHSFESLKAFSETKSESRLTTKIDTDDSSSQVPSICRRIPNENE